jgi:hypothetical protein
VKSLGLGVASSARLGALGIPVGLAVHPGKITGETEATWTRGNAHHGFLVQHAVDPGNPATVSLPQACTKTTFKLDGMPSGAGVSFRIAAIDPASATGQTSWTAWVAGSAK